jgi:hypothetical protein
MNNSNERQHNHSVKDRELFLFVYPVIAFLVVHIGNDNSFSELIRIPSYYTDLLLAFTGTYSAGFYLRWLNIRLEMRFDWQTALRSRLVAQFLFGIFIPVIALVGIELIYLALVPGIIFAETSVFYLELPLITIFCGLINLIYLFLYSRKHHSDLSIHFQDQNQQHIAYKKSFVIHAGTKSRNIPVAEIAWFIVSQKVTFLTTVDGNQYLYNDTLERIKDELDPDVFFQLNRQLVASRESIHSFERTETRKLKVELHPAHTDPVFVSKTKATSFLNWLNQNQAVRLGE